MRPRAIQSVPVLRPEASPFERLEQFARMIVRVPKEEADKESNKADLNKQTAKRKRGHHGDQS
jgi:hypothetical protein